MDLEAVRVRDCTCPGTPHAEGDEVYLLPTLSLEGGAAAELDLETAIGTERVTKERATNAVLARWTATFVRYGAVGWNWLRIAAKDKPSDPDRVEPVPFDVEDLVADYTLARLVAARANELYSAAVLRPLEDAARALTPKPNRQQRRSRRGPTAGSTSRNGSTSKTRRSSSPAASGGTPLQTGP